MPYEWLETETKEAPDISGASFHGREGQPLARLHLWPHRSLPKAGFVFFIGVTFALILLPLLTVLGTPVLWGLLPFMLGALALLYWLLSKSYRDGEILEQLSIWSDHAELIHRKGRAEPQEWQANPYWIDVRLHRTGGPVENYITLYGGGREVELGAFLSAEEREDLHPVLQDILRQAAHSSAQPAQPS